MLFLIFILWFFIYQLLHTSCKYPKAQCFLSLLILVQLDKEVEATKRNECSIPLVEQLPKPNFVDYHQPTASRLKTRMAKKSNLQVDEEFPTTNLSSSHSIQPVVDTMQPVLDIDNPRWHHCPRFQQSLQPPRQRFPDRRHFVIQFDRYGVVNDAPRILCLGHAAEAYQMSRNHSFRRGRARRRVNGYARVVNFLGPKSPQQQLCCIAATRVQTKPQLSLGISPKNGNGPFRIVAINQEVGSQGWIFRDSQPVLSIINDESNLETSQTGQLRRYASRGRRASPDGNPVTGPSALRGQDAA